MKSPRTPTAIRARLVTSVGDLMAPPAPTRKHLHRSAHHPHPGDHDGAEHEDHEHLSCDAHHQGVRGTEVEGDVEATREPPQRGHAPDGFNDQVVPLEGRALGELACPADDDGFEQHAQHEATDHDAEALNR